MFGNYHTSLSKCFSLITSNSRKHDVMESFLLNKYETFSTGHILSRHRL